MKLIKRKPVILDFETIVICLLVIFLRLVETYETVREYHNLDLIPCFAETFPKDFNVSHVVEIWKYTVIYQMKQRRKGAI